MTGFPFRIFSAAKFSDDQFWSFEFGRNYFGNDFRTGNGRLADFDFIVFADRQNFGEFDGISLLDSIPIIDSEPPIDFRFDLTASIFNDSVHDFLLYFLIPAEPAQLP
jgi:hypothetical protein